eukprot:5066257-Pyramimonas_sp.AAC.1
MEDGAHRLCGGRLQHMVCVYPPTRKPSEHVVLSIASTRDTKCRNAALAVGYRASSWATCPASRKSPHTLWTRRCPARRSSRRGPPSRAA